jgi:hypothetical protein
LTKKLEHIVAVFTNKSKAITTGPGGKEKEKIAGKGYQLLSNRSNLSVRMKNSTSVTEFVKKRKVIF